MAGRTEGARSRRLAARVLAVALGVAAVGLIGATAASAHVTVNPPTAQPGSSAELTFRVPNEEAHAATTRVQVLIPTATPIAQLLVRPVPGWTITLHRVRLRQPLVTDDGRFTSAVNEVTWSGGRIEPGEYQDFAVSADPLPLGVDQLVFKTLQTYSNGDVVRWIDVPQPGQLDPEHPAPVLRLVSGSADGSGTVTAAGSEGATGMQMDMGEMTQASAPASNGVWTDLVAAMAVILAGAALCVAVFGIRQQNARD